MGRRAVQVPGCKFASCGAFPGECSRFCRRGSAMWSSQQFRVTSGQGGAISTSGPIAMSISDAIFRTNAAPKVLAAAGGGGRWRCWPYAMTSAKEALTDANAGPRAKHKPNLAPTSLGNECAKRKRGSSLKA